MRSLQVMYYFVFFLIFNFTSSLPIKLSVDEDALIAVSEENILRSENVYSKSIENYSVDHKDDDTARLFTRNDDIKMNNSETEQNNKTEKKKNETELNEVMVQNSDVLVVQSSIRPGMEVDSYDIVITIRPGRFFRGVATIYVSITDIETIDNPVIFQISDLDVETVQFAFGGGTNFRSVHFEEDDEEGTLTIEPPTTSSMYTFIITYNGHLDFPGNGIYRGEILDE